MTVVTVCSACRGKADRPQYLECGECRAEIVTVPVDELMHRESSLTAADALAEVVEEVRLMLKQIDADVMNLIVSRTAIRLKLDHIDNLLNSRGLAYRQLRPGEGEK